jgi:hypothetical protein
MTGEVRSNLKPPTLYKLGVAVDRLKIHGAAVSTMSQSQKFVMLPSKFQVRP